MTKPLAFALIFSLAPVAAHAADPTDRWDITPHFGLSQMSDQTGNASGLGASDGPVSVALDSGFAAGLGVGYRYTKNWGVQFGWEYRSNESSVTLADGQQYPEGNYASNTFYLNGLYHFDTKSRLEPYVGAGLVWVQEIDIDLERNGTEISYDAQGDIGFQLLAGLNYRLSENWSIGGELRVGRISGIELGPIGKLDYNPVTVQLGVSYRF